MFEESSGEISNYFQDKLPKNPMILIVPQLPQLDHNLPPNKGKRSKLWNNQLSNMAKIKHIPAPNIGKLTDHWECFDEMVVAVKAAIIEVWYYFYYSVGIKD